MRNRNTFRFLVASSVCLWPLMAAAQQEGEFMLGEAPEREPIVIRTGIAELGAGWVSSDSFKFGEYSGHQDSGLFGIGNIDVIRRAPYDSEGTRYWDVQGTSLGLESRSLHAEYGHQGTFSVAIDYDQIPHYRFEDAQTPYLGIGGDNLTLPAGWVSSTNTAGMTALNSSLTQFDVETERMRYGGSFTWNFANNWELAGDYRREEKDGVDTIAGIFGAAGGGPAGPLAAILPQPVDQTTDEANMKLAYAGEKLQAELAYSLSLYDNHVPSLTWQNAYDALGGFDPSQDFDNGGQGRIALAPDNSAHNIIASAGYTIDSRTRVVGSFSYGRMLQSDDFLPHTINPNLNVPVPLPRSDLDGQVDKIHAGVTISSRPTRKLDLKGRYTFDDRDNNTPVDVYLTVPGDSQDQGALSSVRARVNRPYSRTSHKVELDTGYRVLSKTKVTVGYDFERNDRDLQEVDATDEHTARIKVRSAPTHYASGWVSYAHSSRSGSEYQDNEPFLVSHSAEYLATLNFDELFENDPALRKYYFSDRERDQVKVAATFIPHEQVTLGVAGMYGHDDYAAKVGLTETTDMNATVDVSYTPTEDVLVTAFATFQRLAHEQNGFSRGGADFPPGAFRALGSKWDVGTLDHAYTVGAELEWRAIMQRLDLTFDYFFSRARTGFDIDAGTSLNYSQLPSIKTTLHSVGLRGDVKVTDAISVRPAYRFEWYQTEDFALDGVHPDTISTVIALGNRSPDYEVHLIGVSAAVRF